MRAIFIYAGIKYKSNTAQGEKKDKTNKDETISRNY
jgi:hypothetical protein